MASSSSSSTNSKWTYDVFLSFRGEDTRINFIDHLYTALVDAGINTFKDDEKLKRGESISTELLKAIEQSRFAIVVFSKNYADSSWCLDELVKIIDCRKSIGQSVLPVFFDVDPSEVRKQKHSYEEAFNKHEVNGGKDQNQMQRWRGALDEAASISGWTLKEAANGHESKCIKQIVEDIFKNLRGSRASNFSKKLIGLEPRTRNVKSLMHTSSSEVQMIGLWGMGGSGKTTLARKIFEDISHEFEGRCFVANVRETSKSRSGLPELQEQIVCDILKQNIKVRNIHDGKDMMSRLCCKRVILVLDDVDNADQLEALAGDRDWFGEGSKIIITTRDEHVLVVHDVEKIHKVALLNDEESILLFNMWAFRGNNPPDEFVETSRLVRHKASGHPLALKVLGSSLCGRDIVEWRSTVERLKREPEPQILDVLQISFDSLKYTEQQIFLDIASLFRGIKNYVISDIFKSCDFHPDIGLRILVEKCLIDISPDGLIEMHDLMVELALNIICEMNPYDTWIFSRLWNDQQICEALESDTGTDKVEAIYRNSSYRPERRTSSLRGLKNMKKLRLLYINTPEPINSSEVAGPEYLSHELRWLDWNYYPATSLPQSFQPEKLVNLSLSSSKMVQVWNGKKAMGKLKYVDLSSSDSLIRTPDFSGALVLEHLLLSGVKLKEIHPSLGSLQSLTKLDLSGCSSLERFNFNFNMTSLEYLNLSDCQKLREFPQMEGDMKRLTKFFLRCTAIEEVHPSIEKLTGLLYLDFTNCKKLRYLPSTIGRLKCLQVLDLSGCPMLKQLPDTFDQLESLDVLFLNPSTLTHHLPALSSSLKKLTHLHIIGRLKSADSMDLLLNRILYDFSHLKMLSLEDCGLLTLPSNLSQMPYLEFLNLNGNDFTHLPNNLSQNTQLKILMLDNCPNLEALAELPQGIGMLTLSDCKSLESLGDLLTGKYKWLQLVRFGNCLKLKSHDNSSYSGLADTLFQTLREGRAFVNYQFSILVPGIGIPNFVSCQLDVNEDYPQLRHLPDWNKRIVGFVVCISLVCKLSERVTIHLGDECSRRQFSVCRLDETLTCDHLWMGYISLELLGQKFFGNRYKNQDDWIRGTKECFLEMIASNKKRCIKKIGIHVMYGDSITEMIEEDEQDHISHDEPRGGLLDNMQSFQFS